MVSYAWSRSRLRPEAWLAVLALVGVLNAGQLAYACGGAGGGGSRGGGGGAASGGTTGGTTTGATGGSTTASSATVIRAMSGYNPFATAQSAAQQVRQIQAANAQRAAVRRAKYAAEATFVRQVRQQMSADREANVEVASSKSVRPYLLQQRRKQYEDLVARRQGQRQQVTGVSKAG